MQYLVKTNGLTGDCKYFADDPDHATERAHRHEAYLRLWRRHPNQSPERLFEAAKSILDMPDFRILKIIPIAK